MKKAISLVLALAMCAGLMLGCTAKPAQKGGSSTGDASQGKPSEAQTLTVWLPPLSSRQDDKAVWDNIMDPFEAENNVTVNLEIVPWGNYEEKYLTGITSGKGPDVGYMYMEMITDFIDMGALEPFDEHLTDADKDNFLYLQNGMIRGKQYCLPIIVGNAIVMCYNKDILEKSGVDTIPSTWDDFNEACKKVASALPDVYPFIQRWGNPAISTLNASFYPYLWQAGGELFNEEGTEFLLDSDAGRAAVQHLYDLKFIHKALPDITTSFNEDDTINYFAEGKAAFVEMETTNTKIFDEAGVNYGFITSLAKEKMSTFVASDALVMMSTAKDKALTYKLIQHMLSGESMTQYHDAAPFPPIAKDEEYHDNPQFKSVYEEDIDALHSLPAVKGSSKIYDMLYKNLQLMMIGEMQPEEVVENTSSYAKTVLSE